MLLPTICSTTPALKASSGFILGQRPHLIFVVFSMIGIFISLVSMRWNIALPALTPLLRARVSSAVPADDRPGSFRLKRQPRRTKTGKSVQRQISLPRLKTVIIALAEDPSVFELEKHSRVGAHLRANS